MEQCSGTWTSIGTICTIVELALDNKGKAVVNRESVFVLALFHSKTELDNRQCGGPGAWLAAAAELTGRLAG